MHGRRTGRDGWEGAAWLYGLAAVVYVALGVWLGGLVLNWVVGPLFPFLVVYLLPRTAHRLRVRSAAAAIDDIPDASPVHATAAGRPGAETSGAGSESRAIR
jgi:hypothetical protein